MLVSLINVEVNFPNSTNPPSLSWLRKVKNHSSYFPNPRLAAHLMDPGLASDMNIWEQWTAIVCLHHH